MSFQCCAPHIPILERARIKNKSTITVVSYTLNLCSKLNSYLCQGGILAMFLRLLGLVFLLSSSSPRNAPCSESLNCTCYYRLCDGFDIPSNNNMKRCTGARKACRLNGFPFTDFYSGLKHDSSSVEQT